jgi:cytochrome b561
MTVRPMPMGATQSDQSNVKHSGATRLFHATLATAIAVQLSTSLIMPGPDEAAGAWIFQVHQYSGIVAAALAFAFWLTIFLRREGTELGAMVPWFSAHRLKALLADIRAHFSALARLRLPPVDQDSALAAAVHGLGLLLMTVMAGTGVAYYVIVYLGLHSAEPDDMLVMQVHFLFANLVWVYLIAHAGLAMLHQVLGHPSLGRMWSFKG